VVFRDELDKIQRDCPSVKVIYIITREKADGCECRRFDSKMLQKYIPDSSSKYFLICGPKELAANTKEILNKFNVPADNVKIECWG